MAVGPYQMWTVAVDEANRIERIYSRRYGRKARRWKYADRRSTKQSRIMAELTLMWHYRRGVTKPIELACRWRNPHSGNHAGYGRKISRAINMQSATE